MQTETTIVTDTASVPYTCVASLAPQGATNHPALTPIHWWHDCRKDDRLDQRSEMLAALVAAFNTGGPEAVIKVGDCMSRVYRSHAWALAMTAVHGPRARGSRLLSQCVSVGTGTKIFSCT